MKEFSEVFREAERMAMGFLESEYSFRNIDRTVIDENGTQYVLGSATYAEVLPSGNAKDAGRFVKLSVAPLRLELDLDIGFGTDKKNRYSVFELHRIEGGGEFPKRQHNLYEAMHDAQQLQEEFEILTRVLRSCGKRFFTSDNSLWVDLKQQRLSAVQAQSDADASRDADKAFTAKQWVKVISLLESRENRLSKVDIAKLAYARKHRGTLPNQAL